MFRSHRRLIELENIARDLRKVETLISLDLIISNLKKSGMSHPTITNNLNNLFNISLDSTFKIECIKLVRQGSLIVDIKDNKLISILNNYN
jgi:hypothetical protein